MTVSSYARTDVTALEPHRKVAEALGRMEEDDIGCVIVTERERPVGIATDRDLAIALCEDGLDPAVTELGSLMHSPVVSMHMTSSLRECTGTMARRGLRRLPLVDAHGKLGGLLCADDLLPVLACELFHMRSPIVSQAPRLRGGYSSRPERSIADHFRRSVTTVAPEAPAREVARRMRRDTVGCVIVVDERGAPVGIVTDRDLALRAASGIDPDGSTARELMTTPLFTVDTKARLEEVIRTMEARSVRRLPVVDGPELVGIISLDDLICLLGRELWDLGTAIRHSMERSRRAERLSALRRDLHDAIDDSLDRAASLDERAQERLTRDLQALCRDIAGRVR